MEPTPASDASQQATALAGLRDLEEQQVRCFRIDTTCRHLEPQSVVRVAAEWERTTDEIWIDLQIRHPREIRSFLNGLSLHPLILEDCLDPHRRSRFSSYDKSLHFDFPVHHDSSLDDYFSVVCVPRILITIRIVPTPADENWLLRLDQETPLNDGTRASVLYAQLNLLAEELIQVARLGRDEIRRIGQQMDSDARSVDIKEIIARRRHLQEISAAAEDQLYSVHELSGVSSAALDSFPQRDYLRDLARNHETVLRVLQRYEIRVAELQQQYSSSLQARTEARLRTLTILSSICMPATLITGIYGMNFSRMPELQWPWGYPATLALILASAAGQLWFFQRRGWFG